MARAKKRQRPITQASSERRIDEGTLADVVAKTITAVQSQKVPAEEALQAAMEKLGAAQKGALELMLTAAKAQAEVAHELLLLADQARPEDLVRELLIGAVERGPEIIDTFSAGLSRILNFAEYPAARQEPDPVQGVEAVMQQSSAPEPVQMNEEQLIDAVLAEIAEGYSAGHNGSIVARRIRVLYPAAIPAMQKYLAMDDFLVLMWMRQQPAIRNIANGEKFPQFYAELKTSIAGNS